MEKYLQMLADSLEKKSEILSKLTAESNRQAEIVRMEEINWTLFDESVERKGKLIDQLNLLDEGFETLYEHIREGLTKDRAKYQRQIQEMQKRIAEVTEKSSTLMATEQRNKVLVTNRFSAEKQKFKSQHVNSKVAMNYYNTMNRMNYIDPQLMDHKK